jgi:hypothetical protein
MSIIRPYLKCQGSSHSQVEWVNMFKQDISEGIDYLIILEMTVLIDCL